MGKPKRRGKPKERADPLRENRPPKPLDPESEALRSNKILPALQELTSSNPSSRSTAATAIAQLTEHDACRKLLLRERLVRVVLDLTITDSNPEVVSGGWMILGRLAQYEDAGFKIHLYRQDILTPLDAALKLIGSSLHDQKETNTRSLPPLKSINWDYVSVLIALLESLSQSNSEIANAICNISAIPELPYLILAEDRVPRQVREATIAFLCSLTEATEILSPKLAQPKWKQLLASFVEVLRADLLGVAACGILHYASLDGENLLPPGSQEATVEKPVLRYLSSWLDEFSKNPVLATGESSSQNKTDRNAGRTELVLNTALQIVASIAASTQEEAEDSNEAGEEAFEPPEDDAMGETEAKDSEETLQDEVSKTEGEGMDVDMDPSEPPKASLREEGIVHQLVESAANILKLNQSRGAGENPIIKSFSPEAFENTLTALNNIAWTVSGYFGSLPSTPSSPSPLLVMTSDSAHFNLYQKWNEVASFLWPEMVCKALSSGTTDLSVLSLSVGLAGALALICPPDIITLEGEEQRKYMGLYQASAKIFAQKQDSDSSSNDSAEAEAAARDLPAMCIGALGAFARRPAALQLNEEIGTFLLTVLHALPEPSGSTDNEAASNPAAGFPPTPAPAALEALDQLFQIYADAGYYYDGPVFQAKGFLGHLDAVQGRVKAMAKRIDARRGGAESELRKRADDAVRELGRFVNYKRKEGAGKQ
ncbi:MAG: hypothetical protein M4579_005672 [Chaenotheca gracillima]|nr:MAG: hypothetical protein M4579_005672 [Chaenotheca gracillima]